MLKKPCDQWRTHIKALRAFRVACVVFSERAVARGAAPLDITAVDTAISWAERQLTVCEEGAERFFVELAERAGEAEKPAATAQEIA